MKVSIQETHPKLHEHQQQEESDKHKMKFNWRANWEVLLVLVIIVVGIVITTIAAIRNKDKHLLVIPDESDYGHLLASAGPHNVASNVADPTQNQVPRLPQIDFQMNNAQTLSNDDDDDNVDGGNDLANSRKYSTPKSTGQQQNSNELGRNPRVSKSGGQQQQQQQQRTTNGQQHAHQNGNGKPNTKYEDHSDHQQRDSVVTLSPMPEPSRDSYEALGTEPTSSQSKGNSNPRASRNSGQNWRNVNGDGPGKQQRLKPDNSPQSVPSDEQLADDIHTTRSSLANSKSSAQLSVTESTLLNSDQLTPSLSLHGPYGLMLPTLANGQHQHTLAAQQNRSKQIQPPTMGNELEDMMTSYSRNNLTDNSQLDAALFAANMTTGDATLADDATDRDRLQQQLPAYRLRNQLAAAHSLPFSVLLSDLIKLTRHNSLINPLASLEKPANSRPQYGGILQQLRSLPAPILALLQNSNNANSYGDHNSMGQTHDMSESNQYYQQIPMSTNDILSVRSVNNLPAFPPPKGTPSVWYPPTVGGNPSIHDAMNSNADFVASNVAGFVRSPGAQGRTTSTSGSSDQTSDEQNYRRQANEVSSIVTQDNSQAQQQYPQAGQQQQSLGNNMNLIIAQQGGNAQANVLRGISSSQNGQMFSNQRPINEMQQAPLGYNPQMQQQPVKHHYEFGGLPSESASKASIAQIANSVPGPAKSGPRLAPSSLSMLTAQNNAVVQPTPVQLNAISRQKRESTNAEVDEEEEEELLDSRLISIVMPDGRPMSKEKRLSLRSKDSRQPKPSSSQRQANHLDLDQRALHHYTSQDNDYQVPMRHDGERNQDRSYHKEATSYPAKYRPTHREFARKRYGGKRRKDAALEAAGSGLMSKLLGTASTNDEQEEDFDGDEDEANERRKEELDDAEFGIVNEKPNLVDGNSNRVDSGETNRATDNGGNSLAPENRDSDSSLDSRGADNEVYTRRAQQQQRADVEFYGHPGEESRHLKYGILGSGNYEVVNGGIYPEADESTAAVNSVANYVRKPGVLLSDLSRLAIGQGPGGGSHHALSHDPTGGAQAAAYMPGGRIAVGHMRGASTNPEDLMGFMPAAGAPGILGPKGMHNPLLELINGNGGHLFDPNLVTQLGSSSRTTFASHNGSEDNVNETSGKRPATKGERFSSDQNDLDEVSVRKTRGKKHRHGHSRTKNVGRQEELEQEEKDQQTSNDKHHASRSKHHPTLGDDSTGTTGGKSQGTNQFYSYQILPSKKVTIFSDQDLDSAPSERQYIPSPLV